MFKPPFGFPPIFPFMYGMPGMNMNPMQNEMMMKFNKMNPSPKYPLIFTKAITLTRRMNMIH